MPISRLIRTIVHLCGKFIVQNKLEISSISPEQLFVTQFYLKNLVLTLANLDRVLTNCSLENGSIRKFDRTHDIAITVTLLKSRCVYTTELFLKSVDFVLCTMEFRTRCTEDSLAFAGSPSERQKEVSSKHLDRFGAPMEK